MKTIKIGTATLIQGDCEEFMKDLPECSIDLTVTSPPYDELREYNGNNKNWCRDVWIRVIQELYRITKNGGVVVWIVGDQTINGSESGTSFEQALYFKNVGFNLHDTMIYQKDNPVPVGGNNRYYQHFEYMFVLSKGSPKTFNKITSERRNKYGDKRTERTKFFNRNSEGVFEDKKTVSLTGDVKIGNVWKYTVGGGISVDYGVNHPAAFPEKMARDHIISWSGPGDSIFDPFSGSGTTAKVCLEEKRNFVGTEKDEDYFNAAVERVIKSQQQQKLF